MTANFAGGSDQGVALCRAGRAVRDRKLILAATVLASSVAFIDGAIVNIALPRIRDEMAGDGALLQWLVTGYLLPLSALQPLAGALGDHFGRRRLLVAGILLFTLTSVLCSLASSIEMLIFDRVAQGVGAALILPNSLAALGSSFEGSERGKAVATWTAAGAIAGALGPPLAGVIIDYASWRWAFLLNLPVGVAALAMTLYKIPNAAARTLPLDVPGSITATLGLLSLTWAVTGASGGSALSFVPGLAGAVVLFGALTWIERKRGPLAMIPPSMFASRAFVGLNLYTLLLYAAFGALFVALPFVLTTSMGYSAKAAGLAILPIPLIIGLASSRAGRLFNGYSSNAPLLAGASIAALGFALLLNVGAGSYWLRVFPAVCVVATGMAILVAPLTTAVLSSVEAAYTATAAGFNSAVSRAGTMIAIAASATMMTEQADKLLGAFHAAALVGVALCGVSALVALLL